VLLSVHCVSYEEISRARDLLTETGAEDIASSGEESINIEGEEPPLVTSRNSSVLAGVADGA
jgi:hypothetical protein